MSDYPLVYAIVLAWNQLDVTLDCLDSLSKSTYSNLMVLLLDNGSTDGTVETVRERFPKVKIVSTGENIGLARGYNVGMVHALENRADYLLPMNNDVVVDPEMVSELVKAMQSHPKAGMVTPKIYNFYGDQTTLWCVGAKWQNFPPRIKLIGSNAPDGPQFQSELILPYVTSCCLMMARQAVEKAGMFDPGYYFYYDDWDISARYTKMGYEIWYIPTAHLWHKVSISTQKSDKPEKWWFVMGRSSVRFYLKYMSGKVLTLYTLWFILRECAKLKLVRRVIPYLCGVAEGIATHHNWRPKTQHEKSDQKSN